MYKIKVLSREDISKICVISRVIESVEAVYAAKSKGETEVWQTVFHDFETGKADLDIKSGYIKNMNLFGHKTVSFFQSNEVLGLPTLNGTLVIYDGTTGVPLGVMDASYITGVRTGAAGAIGAKYLARRESKNLFLLGAGNQGTFQIAAMLTLFGGIHSVKVADPLDFQKAKQFAENIEGRLQKEFGIYAGHVTFEAVEDLAEGVGQSDIIITVTPARAPVIKKEWVKKGTHFSCIGADMQGKEEIDPLIMTDARIYVDDRFHCMTAGEIEIPLKTEVIGESEIIGEIGDLIEGKVTGRTSNEDITIFDAAGMALLDIATAKTMLDLAGKNKVGSTVNI